MDFKTIYQKHATTYEALVACEDYQGKLEAALLASLPPGAARVLDIGTGTGRVARLLQGSGLRLTGSDRSLAMLKTAATVAEGPIDWVGGDNRKLPFRLNWADMVVAGWSLGHSVGWHPESWRREIGLALAEMARVASPSGILAVIETLGTGQETPLAPTQALADYYRWLEEEHGFARQWMRTDYLFESPDEAEHLTRFFFGDDLGDQVRASGLRVVPECTGLWTRQAKESG